MRLGHPAQFIPITTPCKKAIVTASINNNRRPAVTHFQSYELLSLTKCMCCLKQTIK